MESMSAARPGMHITKSEVHMLITISDRRISCEFCCMSHSFGGPDEPSGLDAVTILYELRADAKWKNQKNCCVTCHGFSYTNASVVLVIRRACNTPTSSLSTIGTGSTSAGDSGHQRSFGNVIREVETLFLFFWKLFPDVRL